MKKLLLSAFAITSVLSLKAQTCSELFMSEYVEGDNFNKAIELYNPTGNAIDLANYRLVRWDNGSTVLPADGVQPLSGSIPAHDVVVLVVNTTTQGTETEPDPALVAVADFRYSSSCTPGTGVIRSLCFNGDDAISLQKTTDGGTTWADVDIFAIIGERPTNGSGTFSPVGGWTSTAPYNDGVGDYLTKDKTLVRKSSVKNGVTTNPALGTFNALAQWDSLANNTFDSLGKHTCACNGPEAIRKVSENKYVQISPNPANGNITIKSFISIEKVLIYNSVGQMILAQDNAASVVYNQRLNTSAFENGIYFVEIKLTNGKNSFTKISISH